MGIWEFWGGGGGGGGWVRGVASFNFEPDCFEKVARLSHELVDEYVNEDIKGQLWPMDGLGEVWCSGK